MSFPISIMSKNTAVKKSGKSFLKKEKGKNQLGTKTRKMLALKHEPDAKAQPAKFQQNI